MKNTIVLLIAILYCAVSAESLIAGDIPPANPPIPISFEKFAPNDNGKASLSAEKRLPESESPSLKVTLDGGDYPGIEFLASKNMNASGRQTFIVQIFSSSALALSIRLDDADSKNYDTRFNFETKLAKGANIFQLSCEDIGKKIKLAQLRRIILTAPKAPPGTTLWFEKIEFGDKLPVPEMTADQWDQNPDKSQPNPFIKPLDGVALWHTYNEAPDVEDVLDWSRHGAIGEFCNADHIWADAPDTGNRALRLYGDFEKGKCMGYRIMPSAELTLSEGAVSFWMMVEPDREIARGLILSGGGKNRKNYISCSSGKKGTELTVSFGSKKLSSKEIPVGEWVYVSWTFDKSSQELFINGQSKATVAEGAAFDGSEGFFVGHDGARWEKEYTGSNGFAGALDDLRIFSKKSAAPQTPPPGPSSKTPKLGLLVWYDFDGDACADKSGMGLDGKDNAVDKKGVDGWTKWKESDKAWVFKDNRDQGGSYVELPTGPQMAANAGKIEIRFRCDVPPKGSCIILNSFNKPPAPRVHPPYQIFLYTSAKGALMIAVDYSITAVEPLVRPETPIKAGEWVKLAVAWKFTPENEQGTMDVWINDKHQGTGSYKSLFRMFEGGPLRLGSYPHDDSMQPGGNFVISDLKVYNYCPSVYTPDK